MFQFTNVFFFHAFLFCLLFLFFYKKKCLCEENCKYFFYVLSFIKALIYLLFFNYFTKEKTKSYFFDTQTFHQTFKSNAVFLTGLIWGEKKCFLSVYLKQQNLSLCCCLVYCSMYSSLLILPKHFSNVCFSFFQWKVLTGEIF